MPADGEAADGPSQRYSVSGDALWPHTRNSCVETNVGSLLGEVQAAPTQDLEGGHRKALSLKGPLGSHRGPYHLCRNREHLAVVRGFPALRLPRKNFQEY